MLLTAAPKLFARLLAFTALALLAGTAFAQTAPAGPACPDMRVAAATYQTFYLTNATDHDSFIEIQTVLRNLLQEARINGVPAQNAIAVCASPADLQLAQKVISDFDHARKTYRLTYTITQTGNSDQPAQHIVVLIAAGDRTELKQGSRVPLVTGTMDTPPTTNSQVQYVDIGLNLTAALSGPADGLQLHTKLEQSALAGDKSAALPQDPVITQTVLDNTSTLTPGKPQILGSLNLPGSTGHEQISVTAEPIS